jgi:phage baseplate assembly protein W
MINRCRAFKHERLIECPEAPVRDDRRRSQVFRALPWEPRCELTNRRPAGACARVRRLT